MPYLRTNWTNEERQELDLEIKEYAMKYARGEISAREAYEQTMFVLYTRGVIDLDEALKIMFRI